MLELEELLGIISSLISHLINGLQGRSQLAARSDQD